MKMSVWKPSQENRAKQIRTLQDCHKEFDTTFKELAERTDIITALNAIALTVAARAHRTKDPMGALDEFVKLLGTCYNAVAADIKDGKWNPKNQ